MLSSLISGWFWNNKSINTPADALNFANYANVTEVQRFNEVSRRINGSNELAARLRNYREIADSALLDGNSYENMGAAAARLGLKTSADTGYNEKIGITLRPRTPLVLGGAQLLAAQDNHPADALIELAAQTQAELGLNLSEIDMWFAEPPVDAPVATPTIYLAQKTNLQSGPSSPIGKTPTVQRLGVCQYLTQESTQISHYMDALTYMSHYKNQIVNFRFNPDGTERTDTVVRVLQKPRHGAVVPTGWNETNRHRYEYLVNPNPNQDGDDKFYTGVDSFALEISAGGVTVQIHYRFGIEVGQSQTYYAEGGERVNNTAVDRYCPKGEMWKISQSSEPDASSSNYATWQRSAELSALLANASQALGGFSDLVSTAVGETVGEGLTAQITLDTNAASHGWYEIPGSQIPGSGLPFPNKEPQAQVLP